MKIKIDIAKQSIEISEFRGIHEDFAECLIALKEIRTDSKVTWVYGDIIFASTTKFYQFIDERSRVINGH